MSTLFIPNAITTFIAILALILGGLLFVLSPRLVRRVVQSMEPTFDGHILVSRWLHLYALEAIACILIYSGLCASDMLNPLPLWLALGSISIAAFLLSCLLGRYL